MFLFVLIFFSVSKHSFLLLHNLFFFLSPFLLALPLLKLAASLLIFPLSPFISKPHLGVTILSGVVMSVMTVGLKEAEQNRGGVVAAFNSINLSKVGQGVTCRRSLT